MSDINKRNILSLRFIRSFPSIEKSYKTLFLKELTVLLLVSLLTASCVVKKSSSGKTNSDSKGGTGNRDILIPIIMSWYTENLSAGSSPTRTITLPLKEGDNYNFKVDWGDKSQSIITSWNDTSKTHTYAVAKAYTITITGTFESFYFNDTGDRLKILDISQWGNNPFKSMKSAFTGCENLNFSAIDNPDLSKVTDFSSTFARAIHFNSDISSWDVGSATNMESMFDGATSFNQPIGAWDTSKVRSMLAMFAEASTFNQPIGNWDTSRVIDIGVMFLEASAFNQPIQNWDMSRVTLMDSMFDSAQAFNQPLELWDTSNVENMDYMFYNATSFNQPLGGWDTSKVENMNYMFFNAASFNQDLSNQDVSMILSRPTDYDEDAISWVLSRPSDW